MNSKLLRFWNCTLMQLIPIFLILYLNVDCDLKYNILIKLRLQSDNNINSYKLEIYNLSNCILYILLCTLIVLGLVYDILLNFGYMTMKLVW